MSQVIIAFGSNLGDREGQIGQALDALRPILSNVKISSFYETEPMYVEDQPVFLNGVLAGQSELAPFALLARLKSIEREIGRQKRIANGPREIDLDLIAYEGLQLNSERLKLPHPMAHLRRFVLEPLHEILPDFELIGYGKVSECVHNTEVQSQKVIRVQHAHL